MATRPRPGTVTTAQSPSRATWMETVGMGCLSMYPRAVYLPWVLTYIFLHAKVCSSSKQKQQQLETWRQASRQAGMDGWWYGMVWMVGWLGRWVWVCVRTNSMD